VKQNNLLQREFDVVLPWKGTSGPITKRFSDDIPLAPLFKRVFANIQKSAERDEPSNLDIATARQQLDLRAEQLGGRLAEMGIWSERLNEDGLHKLLYELYNPRLAERQGAPTGNYEGRLIPGFSAERPPQPRRSIEGNREIEPPQF
jgi:hypothetical protein